MSKQTTWLYQPSAGNDDYLVYDEGTGRDVAIVRDFDETHARLIAAAPAMRELLARLAQLDGEPVDAAVLADEARELLATIDGKAGG